MRMMNDEDDPLCYRYIRTGICPKWAEYGPLGLHGAQNSRKDLGFRSLPEAASGGGATVYSTEHYIRTGALGSRRRSVKVQRHYVKGNVPLNIHGVVARRRETNALVAFQAITHQFGQGMGKTSIASQERLPEHAVAKPFIRVRFVTVSRTTTIAGLNKLFKAMEQKRWSSHLNREVVNVIKSFMGASLCPRRGQPIGRADRIAGTGSSWASLGSTSSVHQFVAARRACIFFSGQHTVVYQETTFISWILAVELNNTIHCIETDTFSRVGIRHQGRTPAEAWLGPASRPATGCSFAPLRLKYKKNK